MSEEMKEGTGKVKFFNDQKGYGFICLDDGVTEIFVHQTRIKMDGHRTLYEGQEVKLQYYEEAKGLKADSVFPNMDDVAKHESGGRNRGYGDRGGYDRGYGGGGGYGDRGGGYGRDYGRGGGYDRDGGYGGGHQGYGGGHQGYGGGGGYGHGYDQGRY